MLDSHLENSLTTFREGYRSPDVGALLSRDELAAQLTAHGYRVKEKTLATKASRGGGPPYQIFNGRALYRWGDALDWAKRSVRPPSQKINTGISSSEAA
jgi:hypothetical protein